MDSTLIRRAAVAAVTLVLATGPAACGSGDSGHAGGDHGGAGSSAAALPEGVNEADVAFATQMVPHHQQAVTMSEMAAGQAGTPQVKALAAQIEAAQGPEIETMTGWLSDWGRPAPAEDPMAGHDMSGDMADMEGMMSEQEMSDLGEASGTAFDRMWLDMMVRHHEGAITMAETELADGQDAGAKELAQDIATAQASEIATMKQLLSTLS